MATVVLDASAVLALLGGEPGARMVEQFAGDALISAVNFQEVLKELRRRGIPFAAALEMFDSLHLEIRPHDREAAIAAAELYPATKQYGSGLGDRTCMALGIVERLPTLTADQAWAKIEIPNLEIRLIR